ncbi:MAG: hypothetical protein QNL87_07185 [Gammaproteobacteria bacterium]|nr:hypothetical protein [Gammaproteobacteria bacterium]
MQQSNRKLLTYILAFTLALSNVMFSSNVAAYDTWATQMANEEPTGGSMLADAFMVRPFMLVSTVLGTAAFIVTLPFSLLGGNAGDAGRALVVEPAAYTFVRPLGQM